MPHSVHRKKFILKHIANWKANEYKNFFFYIAIPLFYEFAFTEKNMIFNLYCLVLGKL